MFVISTIIILLSGLAIATVIDIKQRRIPNVLNVSLAIIGLINSAIMSGWYGLGEHILAMAFGLIIFFIFYIAGVYGAGDAKLMAAIGAIMGFPFIIQATVLVIIVGGLISIVILIESVGVKQVFMLIGSFTKALFTGTLKPFLAQISNSKKHAYPFSIAILIGSVMTLWLIP